MFVVEDGTGLPDANSLVSVEYADAYFTLRDNHSWEGVDAEKQAWLVQATDYVVARFRFVGKPLTSDQALPFPRTGTGYPLMPPNLLKAVCEYAVRAKTAPLAPDIAVDETGRVVAGKTEKVGPIEDTVSYAVSGKASDIMLFKPYPAADMLLRGLIMRNFGKVIRA